MQRFSNLSLGHAKANSNKFPITQAGLMWVGGLVYNHYHDYLLFLCTQTNRASR